MFIVIDQYEAGGAIHGRVTSGLDKDGDHDGKPNYSGGWTLSDEWHNWLVERNIEYRLYWSRASDAENRTRWGCWEIEIINAMEHAEHVIWLKMKMN